MELEFGNNLHPSGNLVVYCNVIGDNPIESGNSIIASNVYVSFLTQNDTLPVVTFPPVGVKDKSNLVDKFCQMQKFDVFQTPDFILPDEPNDAQEYIQTRLQEFHAVVNDYVELCSRYLMEVDESWTSSNKMPKLSNEGEAKTGSANSGAKKNAATASADVGNEDVKVRSSKRQILWDFIHQIEKESLTLHEIVEKKEATWDQDRYEKMIQQWKTVSKQFPQYDFQNAIRYVKMKEKSAGKILDLYFKKFRAIYFENYEEAGKIKSSIERLQKKLQK